MRASIPDSTNDLALIPENESLWTESLLWDKDINVRTGAGYKDNVLLLPSSQRGSGFVTTGLDLMFNRLPLDGLDLVFFVTGDDTRYWHDVTIGTNTPLTSEDLVLASVQVQKYLGGGVKAGLELKESYVDQIQYILFGEGLAPAVVQGHMLEARPFIRQALTPNSWVQLELDLTREYLRLPLDDSWKVGPRLVLGRDYGNHSDFTISYSAQWWRHDEWLALDANENDIPGRNLAIWQHRAEINWRHYWDTDKHWRSTTKFGFLYNEDNGAGFFNYYKYYGSEELHFRNSDWELKLVAKASFDDFPVQRTDPEVPSSPKLYRNLLDFTVHLERRLWRNFWCFVDYNYERTISNSSFDEYAANTVMGGISWEF